MFNFHYQLNEVLFVLCIRYRIGIIQFDVNVNVV